MKQLLITIAAVVLAGCEAQPPDILIHEAANKGNAEAVRQHIAAGRDMNAKGNGGYTPLHYAASNYAASKKEIAHKVLTLMMMVQNYLYLTKLLMLVVLVEF